MKQLKCLLFYSLLTLLILVTSKLYAQDANGSQCSIDRRIMVFKKNKVAIEYLIPSDWDSDISKDTINKYPSLYPLKDSLAQSTAIKIIPNYDIPEDSDYDSFVNSEIMKYKNEGCKVKIDKQKDIVHKSIPFGKMLLVENSTSNTIKKTSYIMFQNMCVEFIFEPDNKEIYQKYMKTYDVFISSLRFSSTEK